ncbi:MAG: ferrochelatase [Nitrospiraceae bacterium]
MLGITPRSGEKARAATQRSRWRTVSVLRRLRHRHPFIKEAYSESLDDFPERVIGLCMRSQYSSLSIGAYMNKVEEARAELANETPISFVTSWHRHPLLVAAITDNIQW